jgi:uncharacterized NAD(P)/FAD-binding protein YdhS
MDPIVIAGGGPSTVHLLSALAGAKTITAPEVTIFDRRQPAEGGTPHSDPSPAFRVNMRSELHDIPGRIGFETFLKLHGGAEHDPPLRYDLGRYNRYVAEQAIKELRGRGCSVQRVAENAVALEPTGSGLWTMVGEGGARRVGRIVLATGMEAPTLPADVPRDQPTTYYTGDSQFAAAIRPSDRVVVLGTGPGAIDVARYLICEAGHETPVVLTSRHALLSAVQTLQPVPSELVAEIGAVVDGLERGRKPMTARQLGRFVGELMAKADPGYDYRRLRKTSNDVGGALRQLRLDIAEAAAGGPAWRLVLEAIGAQAPRLWRWIGTEEQAKFLQLSAWYRFYYTKRHAMQMGTAVWQEAQMSSGRIVVQKGKPFPAHDRLVVATGPEYRVNHSKSPLLKQMLAAGIGRAYCAPSSRFEIGGFETRGLQLEGSPGIWVMGALARGEDFAIHGYPALARHAAWIVDAWQ